MRPVKKILGTAVILLIALQFVRPAHNKSGQVLTTDITKVITIPDTVLTMLRNACYDCHSNNTDYPWYSNIQPVGWLLAHHIRQAKNQLNFSEFGTYSQRRQVSKLDGITNSIKDDIMPIKSYKLMHKSSQLSEGNKLLLINWAQQSTDSLSAGK